MFDNGGSPASDKGAFEALKSHWELVLNNVVGGRRAFNRFSRFVCRNAPRGSSP